MIRPFFRLPLFLVFFVALAASVVIAPNAYRLNAEESAADNRSQKQLVDDLMFLTSEDLAGRSSVGPTIEIAAKYLAERFKTIGLDVKLFDGTAFQNVNIPINPQVKSVSDNQLAFVASDGGGPDQPLGNLTDPLELEVDFTPMAIGQTEAVIEGPLVWAGYGITSKKHDYDDYAGIGVAGKVVMMLRKEPGASDPKSPFDGVKNTRHAFFATKIATAIDAGAVAVILVNDSESANRKVLEVQQKRDAEASRLSKLEKQLATLPEGAANVRARLQQRIDRVRTMLSGMQQEIETARRGLMGIAEAGMSSLSGNQKRVDQETGKLSKRPPIPVISLTRDIASKLLSSELLSSEMQRSIGKTQRSVAKADKATSVSASSQNVLGLEAIEQAIDSNWQPHSFEFSDVIVKLRVRLTPAIAQSPNVIGTLPGAGPLANETVVIGAHFDHVGMGGPGSLAPGTIEVHNGADDNASGTAVLLKVAEQMMDTVKQIKNRRRLVFIAFTGEERGLLGSKHYVKYPRFPIADTVAMVNMDMVGRLLDNELTVYGTESASVMNELLSQANETSQVNQTSAFNLHRIGSGYGPSDHASFYEAGVPVLFFFTGLHADYHRPSDDFDKLNLDGMNRITDMVCQVSERLATMPERPVHKQTEANVQIRRQVAVFMGVKLSQRPGEVVFSSVLASSPAQAGGLKAGDQLISIADKPIEEIDQVFSVLRRSAVGDILPIKVRRESNPLELKVQLEARQ